MLSFDQYCAKNGIIGDAKIRFELWLSTDARGNRLEADWLYDWTRYKHITGRDTPRRARVGD